MSFYKTTGASLKEVQDGDLLCDSSSNIYSYRTAVTEPIKPKIFKENRNQIFFIRSSRFLGDKYLEEEMYILLSSLSVIAITVYLVLMVYLVQ